MGVLMGSLFKGEVLVRDDQYNGGIAAACIEREVNNSSACKPYHFNTVDFLVSTFAKDLFLIVYCSCKHDQRQVRVYQHIHDANHFFFRETRYLCFRL